MVFRKTTKTAYKRKTAYRKKAAYPKKRLVSFDKRVKTVISKMAEDKVQNFRTRINIMGYNNTNWIDSIVPMTPASGGLVITQGLTQSSRIGNSIRLKKLKLAGVLRAQPYNVTTNTDPVPIYVKFLFLTRRDSPMAIYPTVTDILQFGSTSEAPGTALLNIMRPVNTDEWVVHTTKIFKLGYSSYTGTSSDAAAQYNSNNDFKLNHFVNLDLTKYCNKIFKFDDNTSNPSNRNVVLYPIVYAADNSDFLTNAIPAVFDYTLDITYEDV